MKPVRLALLSLYSNLFLIILFLVCFFAISAKYNKIHWSVWLILILIVISGISILAIAAKNILNSIVLYKNRDHTSLRRCMKALKLGLVPYFVINFALYALMFLLTVAASRGFVIFSPVPLFFLIPVFFTYLAVLFTSSYGIGYVFILKKENRLSSGRLIIYVLLQICFVLDVISTVILLIKYKKDYKGN